MPFVYEEKQAKPLRVEVEFYDPAHGHVAVAPDSFYEDERVVGYILAGTNKAHKYVRYGDAIIRYPGEPAVYDAMPPEELSAYFVLSKTEPVEAPRPALAERFAEPSIDDVLKEQT
jgi:hypothetical protein